jgi:hypothetical protein
MATTKITKASLLSQMEGKLQSLNLLKAALQAENHIRQADLEDYKKRFDNLMTTGKARK